MSSSLMSRVRPLRDQNLKQQQKRREQPASEPTTTDKGSKKNRDAFTITKNRGAITKKLAATVSGKLLAI
jgi:hypothetical protein